MSLDSVTTALDDVREGRSRVRSAIETLADAREESGRSSAHDTLTEAFAALTTAESMLSGEQALREESDEVEA